MGPIGTRATEIWDPLETAETGRPSSLARLFSRKADASPLPLILHTPGLGDIDLMPDANARP